MKHIKQLIAAGKVDQVNGRHSHLHNEFLDAWVKRGIPGLLSTLLVFLVPLSLFIKQSKQGDTTARPYAMAGIALIVAYLAFGFTQAFLTHINGVVLYAFSVAVFWAAARNVTTEVPTAVTTTPTTTAATSDLG